MASTKPDSYYSVKFAAVCFSAIVALSEGYSVQLGWLAGGWACVGLHDRGCRESIGGGAMGEVLEYVLYVAGYSGCRYVYDFYMGGALNV